MIRRSLGCWLAMLLLAGCSGGGADIVPVTGRVTLDGKPLAGARVRFQPENSGSPSYGTADQDGRYELGYNRDQPGALVGWHAVQIELGSHESSPASPKLRKLPARYNEQTELRREVTAAGENTIDFELTSS
jgi:hypothetical protein